LKCDPSALPPHRLNFGAVAATWQLETAFVSPWRPGSWSQVPAFVAVVAEDSAQLFFISLEQAVSEHAKGKTRHFWN